MIGDKVGHLIRIELLMVGNGFKVNFEVPRAAKYPFITKVVDFAMTIFEDTDWFTAYRGNVFHLAGGVNIA